MLRAVHFLFTILQFFNKKYIIKLVMQENLLFITRTTDLRYLFQYVARSCLELMQCDENKFLFLRK